MHAIVLSVDAAALLGVAAAFGAAIVLYGTWKTRVLRLYMLFIGCLAAFAVAMTLQTVPEAAASFGIWADNGRLLSSVGLVIQGVGGVVLVAILPHFTFAINNRHPSITVQRAFLVIALLMSFAAILFIVKPARLWIGYLLTGGLFASIAWCLGRMVPWLSDPQQIGAAFPSVRALRSFLWISLGFLVLFVVDILVSSIPVPNWVSSVDGISLPLYLLVLSLGSIAFGKTALSAPALYEDGGVTVYCRDHFGLTDREAEVIEYVMEGYSVPDLSAVLGISAKTAEHHLYNAYQKLAVSNRIQLFNILMARR